MLPTGGDTPIPGGLAISAVTLAELQFRVLAMVEAARQPRRQVMDLLITATAPAHNRSLCTRNANDLDGREERSRQIPTTRPSRMWAGRTERPNYARFMRRAPRPPAGSDMPGVDTPTAGDARTYVGWRVDGYLYEAQTARGIERWVAFWLAGQTLLQTPFLIFFYAAIFSSPRRRYYTDADRSAILGITVRGRTWRILDHAVDRPGSGSGQALRERIQPQLLAAADRAQIPIVTKAASAALAEHYEHAVPGLKGVRRAFPRGVLLRREPYGGDHPPS